MSISASRHGSVYLVTLVTVAAIVSMVLIGVKLRLATTGKSQLVEEMAEGNTAILSATEFALQAIGADTNWKTTAQSGVIFADFELGDSIYTCLVTDVDTAATPTDFTTTYRLNLSTATNTVLSSARIDISYSTMDYLVEVEKLGASFYWPLDEVSKSTQALEKINKDAHGTYLVPTIAGTATNDEGALVPLFADANDYVEVPWERTFATRNGSISLWMKLSSDSRFATTSLLGSLYQSGGNASINISIREFGVSSYICDDGTYSSSNFAITKTDLITPNTWHHIVMTWGANGLYTYIDGVEEAHNASNTMPLNTTQANKGGQQPIHFGGGYLLSSFTHTEEGFDGSIAHVVFYGSQLAAEKVAWLSAIKPDLISTSIVNNSWVRVFE